MPAETSFLQQTVTPPLLLSDGHAGNRRQAEALARALGHADAPHLTLHPRLPARLLAPRRFPLAGQMLGAEFARCLQQPPEVAIGCGRQAALATRLLRLAGSQVVQILHPRIDTRHWDWIIAPAHDLARGANIITLHGSLNPVDAAWLAQARHEFPAPGQLPGPRVALLVGGPSRHWPMPLSDFAATLAVLGAAVAAQGGSLMATASRRTPRDWHAALQAMNAALYWQPGNEGRNPYPGLIAWADVIVCTADSVNMLSEAAASEAPLYLIGAEWLQGRPRHFLQYLHDCRRVRDFSASLAPFAVSPLRQTAQVAAKLQSPYP